LQWLQAAQPAYLYIAAMRGITRSCRDEVT
jgi:hypothetical protein